MTSLLTPLSKDPGRNNERFLHNNKGSSNEKSSPRLEHASKEARPEPPSSAHLSENDKDPQEPSKAMATQPSKAMATPRAPDGFRQDTRDSSVRPKWNLQNTQDDDITPRPMLRRRGLVLEERVIHRWGPDKNTPLSLPVAHHIEGIPVTRHRHPSILKFARHEWTIVESR